MKISKKNISTAVCCIAAISFTILYFYLFIFHMNDFIHTSTLFNIAVIITLSTFLSVYLLRKNNFLLVQKKHMWYFIFIIYLVFLAYLLFFSKNFNRRGLYVQSLDEYLSYLRSTWEYGVNLKPFSSIDDMLTVYNDQAYGQYSFVNIFGNLIAFMPFAFFMKVINKNITFLRFLGIISIVVACVEILQFLSGTGAMDIDDFILNVVGSMSVFCILKVPFLHKGMDMIR
ncbi:VanZ family protein [Amedibacillus sp. YH-ame10]